MAQRVTQEAVEVLERTTSVVRATQAAVEVLESTTSVVRVTQVAVEVLRVVTQAVIQGDDAPIWVGFAD